MSPPRQAGCGEWETRGGAVGRVMATPPHIFAMTDTPIKLDKGWHLGIGLAALAFCFASIVRLLLYGKSENLLHQNALSWSYIVAGGILAGFGFGAIIEFMPWLRSTKTTTP